MSGGFIYVHEGQEVCCLWLNILLSFEAEKIVRGKESFFKLLLNLINDLKKIK